MNRTYLWCASSLRAPGEEVRKQLRLISEAGENTRAPEVVVVVGEVAGFYTSPPGVWQGMQQLV